MLYRTLLVLDALAVAWGQTPEPESSSQIQVRFALGQRLSEDIEKEDGRLDDQPLIDYVQQIANRLALAAAVKTMEVRMTRGTDAYAKLLPNGRLYLSAALFQRLETEAELAGLLAHELAHRDRAPLIASQAPILLPACVLAFPISPGKSDRRDAELQSTTDALQTLRKAGYEPSALLDLLSKLAFDHPAWARAILPDDLLLLRAALENDVLPPGGYVIDSSQFRFLHARH